MKTNSILLIFVFLIFGISGCTVVSNLDQITTLQGYSSEKEAQHKDVKIVKVHYDALTKAIDQGQINDFKDQASFIHAFGDPILKKEMNDGTGRWLYRYAIFRLAKDKVYVYFDRDGKLVKWEKMACSLSP